MKRLFSLLCMATLFSGCASLSAISAWSEDSVAAKQEIQTVQSRVETMYAMPSESYPKVIVTPEGKHATMMPPCGNLAVIVNPDGSHSTALVNGNTASILTP